MCIWELLYFAWSNPLHTVDAYVAQNSLTQSVLLIENVLILFAQKKALKLNVFMTLVRHNYILTTLFALILRKTNVM